jgi:hypothetical protein
MSVMRLPLIFSVLSSATVICDPVELRQLTFDLIEGFFSGCNSIERRRLDTMPESRHVCFAVRHGALQLIESQIAFRDGRQQHSYFAFVL